MSHTVTVRTATVTTSSTGVFINTGYVKSYRGMLKILELILGVICVGIVGNELDRMWASYYHVALVFFLLMATTFMIGTFLLLLSAFSSISSESLMSKTIHEVIYHAVGFALLLAASLNLMVKVTDYSSRRSREYELLLGASICGLVNCALYFASTIFALRMYRGF